MTSDGIVDSLILLVIALVIFVPTLLLRRTMARRGPGAVGQLQFRRTHGEQVAHLLDGRVDPDPTSPWIDVRIAGRSARMVAAPLSKHRYQAGIELLEWQIPIQIWFTNGDPTELEVPDGIDHDEVLALVAALREAEVDNVTKLESDDPPLVRMQFDTVAELPARLERIAPLLERLERLTPPDRDA